MIKRPFLIFIFVLGTLITALLWFIQSSQFAGVLKSVGSRYLPKDIGIIADFSELSIKLYPPGLSIGNPKIVLGKRNIANLPEGSSVTAERIDFSFHLFQMFSGDIRVNELTIVNGQIQLYLTDSSTKKKTESKSAHLSFHWDELFHVRAEAVALQNVKLNLEMGNSNSSLEAHAQTLRLAQWTGKGGLGYSMHLDLSQIHGTYLKSLSLPQSVDRIQGIAYVNALGLNLESLNLFAEGVEASIIGQLKGNLLEPKGLVMDASVRLKGNIAKAMSLYPASFHAFGKEPPTGSLFFTGKVDGNISKISETFKAEGLLTVGDFAFQKWGADLIQSEIKWVASPAGGEISLLKTTIRSQQKKRAPPLQAGWGGQIEIGTVKWVLGSIVPIKIPLHFEHAHLHWLGGSAIKALYPLDFRLSGDIALNLEPRANRGSWRAIANLDSAIEEFQLDNQRYQQTKPLRVVFKIPKITLKGSVMVDSSGIHPTDLAIGLPNSKIVAHGKIDFKTGYDLYGSGTLQLTDFGKLAEQEIRGAGAVNVHVHGPAASVLVDIDTDLKDAYYLGLFLGGVKGQIVWDDDNANILFRKAYVNHGDTSCMVDGILDVGKTDSVDLKVRFDRGDIQDLIQIFGNLTQPMNWFPHQLRGAVKGDILISGGIGLDRLQVVSNLNGDNWDYMGERFRSVTMVLGYDRGKYFINKLRLLKRFGTLIGNISYDAFKKFNWDLHTEGANVGDLDAIAQLDLPIRGKLKFNSSGNGVDGSIESTTELNLDELTVRGLQMPASSLSLGTQSGITRMQVSAVGGQGVLDVVYDSNPKQLSTVRGELKQFDFSPILLLLNTRSIRDRALVGRISGGMNFSFRSNDVDRANGSLSVTEYVLGRSDTTFQLESPFVVKVANGNFAIEDVTIKGPSGSTTLALKSGNSRLEGNIVGDLDISLAEFFIPSLAQASGIAKLDFAIGGTIREPTLFGHAELMGNTVRVFSLESPFENVTGLLELRQNFLTFQRIQSDLGGGRVGVEGRIEINVDRYPTVRLKSTIANARIKIYPFQFAKLSGSVEVHGEELPYAVDGNVVIDSALSKEKMLNQKNAGMGLKALQYVPPPNKQSEGNYSKFKLNIGVEAQKGIMIQNDLFRDAQAKGNLTLVNTLEAPRVLGSVEITQGQLMFKDHVFQIQSATANFDNPTVINPSFDLNASTEVNKIKIRMYATGRPDKIKVEFTSNPAMQESEILSLLTVGLTSSDAKRLSANDFSAVQQGEAASLVLHSLDFNREIEDKTGFHVQLDESVNPQTGNSAFRPQSQTDASAAPQIIIRRKLGDRLSLSAGSTVGAGTNKSNQVNMDFSVNQDISITGVFNNYGTYSSTDVQSTTQATQNSYGLDLKFQKRFK